ncbi:FHA domain-containing protein [uncultured Micrococcus sp.]|uniref:FHA domain-containing protein FhaB/FipA n=1 Tax=uncultured Micrococcus sp. TaxID=114051 RepID=UPI0025946D2A|nr:FHA domain-containing protein [uncultured Micrococcus sp.]
MNELAIAALRFGLLLALWILIVSIVASQGRDLIVGKKNKLRMRQAQQEAVGATSGRSGSSAAAGAAGTGGSRVPAPEQPTPPDATDAAHQTITPVSDPTPAPKLARTLRITDGPKAGTRIGLGGEPLLMGRAQDADLVLEDDYASGRHARLFPQGTRWFLEDLGSTNGTFVDGTQVTRALPVGPDNTIRIGKTVMEIED